jgi:hypothetical protein
MEELRKIHGQRYKTRGWSPSTLPLRMLLDVVPRMEGKGIYQLLS